MVIPAITRTNGTSDMVTGVFLMKLTPLHLYHVDIMTCIFTIHTCKCDCRIWPAYLHSILLFYLWVRYWLVFYLFGSPVIYVSAILFVPSYIYFWFYLFCCFLVLSFTSFWLAQLEPNLSSKERREREAYNVFPRNLLIIITYTIYSSTIMYRKHKKYKHNN